MKARVSTRRDGSKPVAKKEKDPGTKTGTSKSKSDTRKAPLPKGSHKVTQEPPRKRQLGEVVEPYVPNKSDPVDVELAKILNSFNNDFVSSNFFKFVHKMLFIFLRKRHCRFLKKMYSILCTILFTL